MRKTIHHIAAQKNQKPIVCLTAYTAPMARAFDTSCDILLVGDSVAMVVYGEPSTLQADIPMMIRHGRAVQNATKNAMVVIDMPFGSYQESKETAFANAARILKETGAAAVKLEGGEEMAQTVSYLYARGIPVMGHVGLQPQSINAMGGFKTQGRDQDSASQIMKDAVAIDRAGAFAMVIEGVPEALAAEITKAVACPTIGIGASAQCDGQILVGEDMLGATGGPYPKFVKNYARFYEEMEKAVQTYAHEVRTRAFPQAAHVYASTNPKPMETPIMAPQETTTPPLKLELEPLPEDNQDKTRFFDTVLRATKRF